MAIFGRVHPEVLMVGRNLWSNYIIPINVF